MKKIFVLLALVLLVTGCSVTEKQDLEKIVDDVLVSNENFINKNFSGYEYYLPRGVMLINKLGYNSTLKYKTNQIYLYVDVISYYHKIEKKYERKEEIYFSKKLKYDEKKGYINVTKTKDKDEYYVEIEYNYGKIEFYTNEANLNGTIINSLLILKTLRYNDAVIESLIGENKIEYKEEKYNLKVSKTEAEYLGVANSDDDSIHDDILVDEDTIELENDDELDQ
jgi:hypothetical protein